MPTNQQLVLASSNQGKLKEFTQFFATHFKSQHIEVMPQSNFAMSDAKETGLSFIENAIIKARHGAAHTGLPTLADDSGLSVKALKGAPGIYSARFAGEHASDADNIKQLLSALKDLPEAQREAEFHCVLAYMRHAQDPNPQLFIGTWQGRIVTAPKGHHGFGYDPIFYCPKAQCTAAELSPEQKQALSHRGKALALMARNWQA